MTTTEELNAEVARIEHRKITMSSGELSDMNIRLSNIRAAMSVAHDGCVSGNDEEVDRAHGVLDLAMAELQRVQADLEQFEVQARNAELSAEPQS